MRLRTLPTARRQRGLSLIELMVALTLDLVIIAAVIGLFLQGSKYRQAMERANIQIENGRYAMQVLSDDLQMAGYYGQLNVTNLALFMTSFATRPDPCGATLEDLNPTAVPPPPAPQTNVNGKPFLVPLQAYDGGAALGCLEDRKPDTDIVVVRRVSNCIAGAADCDVVAGAPYFQASSCNDLPGQQLSLGGAAGMLARYRLDRNLANLDRNTRNCVTLADRQQFFVRIYYIANNDNPGDGIPTLKRAELTGNDFTIVPIANGIEDLQLEYGIDNVPDGIPDAFTTDPDSFGGCAAAPCAMANTLQIVAANIHLLARNLTERTGYTDAKAYTLGSDGGGGSYVVGPFSDGYERHVYEGSVRLMNPSLRRQPPGT